MALTIGGEKKLSEEFSAKIEFFSFFFSVVAVWASLVVILRENLGVPFWDSFKVVCDFFEDECLTKRTLHKSQLLNPSIIILMKKRWLGSRAVLF